MRTNSISGILQIGVLGLFICSTAGAHDNNKIFSPEVENCIKESRTHARPIFECYNLYLGRNKESPLFPNLRKSIKEENNKYGPFVRTPLERLFDK